MRKTSSTGRISDYQVSSHFYKMKQRFAKNLSNNKNLKLLHISNYPSDKYQSNKTTKILNKNLSLNQNELYDELMYLKKKVNNLNSQISYAKSQKMKKEMQINTKKKELENYMSEIHMSKDMSPVNIDKLKDSNMISLIKKEYYKVKRLLNNKKNEANLLDIYLKKAKPNTEIKKNEDLEYQLKTLVSKYIEIQSKNDEDSKTLQGMANLTKIFQSNHNKIEEMKNLLLQAESNINRLKSIAENINNENNKNNEILRKQNINKINMNKHIEYLMNEKKNKEEIVKMKAIYEKKIRTLEDELNDYKDKCNKNDANIHDLKEELKLLEKVKKVDQFKLKEFDYNKLKKLEKDPLHNVNSKIILFHSLIDESNMKVKMYKNKILEFNKQLKIMGYEPFEVDDLLNNEDNKNNNDIIIEEKTNEGNNNLDSNKENKNINDDKDNKDNKEKEIIKDQNDNINENEKENENINIKNNLESGGRIIESTKEEETKNDNNININPQTDKREDIKDKINKNNSEESDNYKEIKISDNNEKKEEIKINNNEENNNNDIILNSSKNNNTEIKFFTEEEFSEFTFVLIKNFEAKKVTVDIAKEKIILIQNKSEEIPNETFIQQMSHNILKCLNCKKEESIQKINKWLFFLLNISENNQQLMTQKFLSLLTNIKIYSPEEELLLSKKVKKCLLPKKDILLSKLKPFENKFISFLFLKQIIEEQRIEMKDEYSQYLFYALKKFDEPDISLYDLKVKNLFDLMNNDQNDSKMDEESDIEITNEEFMNIISGFIIQLLNYMNKNKVNLREILKGMIQNLSVDDEENNNENIEVVLIEPFINKMKEIGIQINNDIETFCIFNRYKLMEDYEIISVNLLEKELDNFKRMESNNINNVEKKEKVMEKVQEETEDNISIN